MLLANLVVVVVAIGACVLLALDSIPAKAVRYALVRWRHRRKVGASSTSMRFSGLTFLDVSQHPGLFVT
jgi:hypothetical protein